MNNKIALLPLDNRPVSYLLPKQIADFSDIDLILPERNKLGDLNKGADFEYIENWCRGVACNAPTMVISLDTWMYGGLVQSRKHNFSLEELKKRVDLFVGEDNYPRLRQNIYGFSTIMRIPNYNSSEEEKDYWKDYGEKIFKWSYNMHKVGRGIKNDNESYDDLIDNWYKSTADIPIKILLDYKALRDKNFGVNIQWLESLHNNLFNYLIFSCDDSSDYGMNVVEAEYLIKEIRKHKFREKAKVISGTDEIPLILMTKSILETCSGMSLPKISIYYNDLQGRNEKARYEQSSIYKSITSKVEFLTSTIYEENEADIILFVHLASSVQGDHIFKIEPEDTRNNAKELVKEIEKSKKPFMILDLAYANGADPNLINELKKSKVNWDSCYGYAGWNTCSNSAGTVLAMGINRWISERRNIFNKEAFKKCLLTRFLDDYAYQAIIRHPNITEKEVNEKIRPYIQDFSKIIGLDIQESNCVLPWRRSFEIEINP